MKAAEDSAEVVREQLERILASPGFIRNDRLSGFLRFVVEQQLAGKADEIKESLIGVEVFRRRPDYNPRVDAVVRIEAAKLRSRLLEYYAIEGVADPVVIELPKGRYFPVFHRVNEAPEAPNPRPKKSVPLMTKRRWRIAALAGLIIAMAATSWWVQRKAAPVAIAVLPLENLSHDPDSDFFADGLTDELIRNLSIIEGLTPRSRTSSFAFKGKPRNMREVGNQLGADYILEGSVLRDGGHLRINVQLVRVRDDSPLWSGRYDRESKDVFAIQDEISRGIVNSLRLKLGRGRRRYETSTEAYELYLRALAVRGAGDRIPRLEEVIHKDPLFAPAYASLATAYAFRSGRVAQDADDSLVKMRSVAEKAIQLDPMLAEAHAALGAVYARDAQWDLAEKSFRRAIELDPANSESYILCNSYLLLPLNRIEEDLRQLRTAEKVDPLSPDIHYSLFNVLLAAGRFDEAKSHCQKLEGEPLISECLGRVCYMQGRTEEAVKLLAAAVNQGVAPRVSVRNFLGYALGRAGRREQAEQIARADGQHPFPQALVFAGLGDKDRTFEALERLARQGPVRLGRNLAYPEFALMRGDPRVKALRKKVGLPD